VSDSSRALKTKDPEIQELVSCEKRGGERDSSEPSSVRSVFTYTYGSIPKTIRRAVVSLMCCTSTILYHLVMHFEGN